MRRLLQNYKVRDLFSISIILLLPHLNQTLFHTSSSLSLSFCWLMQPTVFHCSPTPRLGSAYAPCPSILFSISLGTPVWLTQSWMVNHQSLIMASQWVSLSHIAFARYPLPPSVQTGMLGQRSFSQSIPGKGGPDWKHAEVQSLISAKDHFYWLYRKSWWKAYCWLLLITFSGTES